jgi:hypothetical protein
MAYYAFSPSWSTFSVYGLFGFILDWLGFLANLTRIRRNDLKSLIACYLLLICLLSHSPYVFMA